MATNTAGDVGQVYPQNMVHYLAKTISYTDDDATVTVGTLPPNAVVIDAGVVVTTAFSGGTVVLDVGVIGGDTNAYISAASLETAGRIEDTALNANDDYSTSAIQVGAYVTSNSTITAGLGVVYIEYILADR